MHNMKIPTDRILKFACVALILSAAAVVIQHLPIAHAALAPLIRVTSVNGVDPATIVCPANPLTSPVTIVGNGQGSTPPGRVEQYGVMVNWGDGSPVELANATFTPPRGKQTDFTFIYVTNPHVYANGTYTITLSLFHSQGAGNDNQIDSTVQLQVCTITPNAPAIEVDLLNGEDPSSFSCPDNPVSGPVTIEGGGQGSAPPGAIQDYRVVVNWGDGTAAQNATTTLAPSSGTGNFTYSYITPAHDYAVAGSYTATLSLVRSSSTGDVVAASRTLGICSFTPVAHTIEVDLINGADPTTIVCPDSPTTNPVTIEGGGEGSAPPGTPEDYSVVVDWGDGTAQETASTTLVPATGTPVNFIYSFETAAHEYEETGTYTVTLSLVRADASGEDVTVVSTSTDVCVEMPTGIVTGRVIDAATGLPIFGAVVEDNTDGTQILGSFHGNLYVIHPPVPPAPALGTRTIRVTAEGWQDGVAQAVVMENEVTVLNFALNQIQTELNVVEVTLPINSMSSKTYLLPECIEAVVDGEVVATSCVHAGNIFYFVGLPDGVTTFRSGNSFYSVQPSTVGLDNDAKDPGDDAPNKNPNFQVRLFANVPEQPAGFTRAAVVTGTVAGVTTQSDGVTRVATTVYATFDDGGTPVTVWAASSSNGVYAINLVPAGATEVYAQSTANNALRSPDSTVNVVGGTTVTKNLSVFPFDAETANFVPVVTAPAGASTNEDQSVIFGINDFSVADGDDSFSAEHTLQVYPGNNYTVSNQTATGAQVNPLANFFGTLVVPVTVSDSLDVSSPFPLYISVNSTPDMVFHVNFDTGKSPTSGGDGSAANPYKTLAQAVSFISPQGVIEIAGLATSTEPPLVINKAVILQNNNAGGQPVRINPSVSAGVSPANTSTGKTGFVSQSK